MSANISRQDLRVRKTKKSLNDAMVVILEKCNFGKITIKDICDEALISRATFYSHYNDKYDLLKCWLMDLQMIITPGDDTYDVMEKSINHLVDQHKKIIRNILEDADRETLHIVFDVILLLFGFSKEESGEKASPKHIVFSNVFAGGMTYYLLWHVEHKFPLEVMNIYLYDLIKRFQAWDTQ